ncbi:serine--tRNA ligase [Prosthecochloris sp. N3]|uniref:Serine--tRNA ligase n=1 Tax=Prosthecochloris ethylica TaxID=2743976 RepID=A0ABR9XRL4_9CHLB|nr:MULTISPECIES: serine--tRNA ligase [Prosthecochloris]MBF0586775.1 serine--tRNA ligase [Prosthecochloris ethylica]MBF0636681.1 serine--tRNA ligase [Prosthecochloris ethylica]NUK47920.1 serine--tRNA ligase [Prosthecochloris ethylica]RNA65222.1 serine--tRNA ligase [Prosthecochloris sp. ZM_2]
MLDINFIRQHPEKVSLMLEQRQQGEDIAKLNQLLDFDKERRELIKQSDDLKALRNKVSKDIAVIKRSGQGSADDLIQQMKEVADTIAGLDEQLKQLAVDIEEILLSLPNKLHDDVPVGASADENVVWKEKMDFQHDLDFKLSNHLDLGRKLGILDFERGAKITGAGFPLYKGKGARLERALINFMLDVQTGQNGYTEVMPPLFVNQDSLRGTGQWPKFADQVYYMNEDNLYAIPTAEVPVTNMHRNEILDAGELPLCYAASTPCFRREAGSYGKDTRGFLRVHQFNKVELVRYSEPEHSYEALEQILANAESILHALEIPYRVLLLCSGDISANATKCYDIEVWAPAEEQFLEASSCSNFEDYQARRASIRYRPKDGSKPAFVHTLNGSGLATSRLMVALLENYQTPEGTIRVPEALQPYTGFSLID